MANEDPTIKNLEKFLEEEDAKVAFLDDEDGMDGNPDNSEDKDTIVEVKYKRSVCNVSLGNHDLPNIIVNGFPGDPIEL